MMRALIVDDEAPARARLRLLLDEMDGVEVAGEAEDGESALAQIEALKPDVVFLDIQMPGCSGLEVAASLRSPRPPIVFCTAFDQYAVDAFEVSAVDYLLKPVNRARLAKAVEKVRRGTVSDEPLDRLARRATSPMRFLARAGAAYRVVNGRDVVCFVSENGLTRVHAAGQAYELPPTLNELEARLDPRQFFRISRAAIVSHSFGRSEMR